MNPLRWIGSLLFVLALVGLVAVASKDVAFGQEKKEDKKETKVEEKKTPTTEEKKETKTEEKKTTAAEEKKAPPAEEKKTPAAEEKKATAAAGWQPTALEAVGKSFYQEVKTVTKQKMTVMTQTVDQNQDQTFVLQWTPKAKDAKGYYVVTQKIVGVKMNIDINGTKIAYDSTKKDQAKNPMNDFFGQLMGQELTFTVTPEFKVESIEGRDTFIAKLSETNPQMGSLLKTILSDDSLKRMAEPTWWALPTKAVNKGDTWKKDNTLNLGPIGSYKTTFDFSYGGKVDNLEKINITKADMKYTEPTNQGGLPFTIKKGSLESKEGSGEAFFDPAKGRLDSSKITMKLGGTLSIDVGNMTTEIAIEQTQDSSSKTMDALPDAWKTK